jgi:hypothetical protein
LYEAIPAGRRTLHEIKGANHYYFGQKQAAAQAASLVDAWLRENGFAQ